VSKVISLRLKDRPRESLQRIARRMGRTPTESAAILLDEMLRQCEFAFIEFRDSSVGRQAYLQGTRLKIWQVVSITRDYGGDIAQAAAHLSVPTTQVVAALNYAKAFPDEIEAAIRDNECSVAELERLIPNLEVVNPDASSA
jgi:uncharacterized protein (DUF433 family)